MYFWYNHSPVSNIKLSVLFFLHKTVQVCQNQHDISALPFDIFRFIMFRRYLKALHSFSLEGLMTTKGGKETLHAIQYSMQTLLPFELTSNTSTSGCDQLCLPCGSTALNRTRRSAF